MLFRSRSKNDCEVWIAYVERCVFEDTKYKASCLSSKGGERDSAKLEELTGRRFDKLH